MLRWNFKEKAGTVTQKIAQKDGEQEWTFNFYEGNAFMITTYEYEEDGQERYQMQWFFADERHAKICLGQSKGSDGTKKNIFDSDSITQLTLYRDHCREWSKIASLFAKAFPKIRIERLGAEPIAE